MEEVEKQKRKRTALSYIQKLQIIEKLENGASKDAILRELNIGKETLRTIMKNKEEIKKCCESDELQNKKSKKSTTFPLVENALKIWFYQNRDSGNIVSGAILQQKALDIYKKFSTEGVKMEPFSASEGWINKFKYRHGIRELNTKGEMLSSDSDAIESSVPTLREKIRSENLLLDNIYNADESGIEYRSLCRSTLGSRLEKSAGGSKESQEIAEEEGHGPPITTQDTNSFQTPISSSTTCQIPTTISSQQTTRKGQKRKQMDSDPKLQMLDDALQLLQSSNEIATDPYYAYGQHLANELRKYDPSTLSYVKKAISDILFEADVGTIFNRYKRPHFMSASPSPQHFNQPSAYQEMTPTSPPAQSSQEKSLGVPRDYQSFSDGSRLKPTIHTRICSDEKSGNKFSPSDNPTIFPAVNQQSSVAAKVQMGPGTSGSIAIKETPLGRDIPPIEFHACQGTGDPLEFEDVKLEPYCHPEPSTPPLQSVIKEEAEVLKQTDEPNTLLSPSGEKATSVSGITLSMKTEPEDFGIWEDEFVDSNER